MPNNLQIKHLPSVDTRTLQRKGAPSIMQSGGGKMQNFEFGNLSLDCFFIFCNVIKLYFVLQ